MDLELIMPPGRELFDEAKIKRSISDTRDEISERIAVDFIATVETWSNEPKVQIVKKSNNEAEIFIVDKRYTFVNNGTRVRYATMTPDFQAKTVPRIIASGPGQGGVAFVSRAHPRPGIKGRFFDEEIAKKWNKLLPEDVDVQVLAEL